MITQNDGQNAMQLIMDLENRVRALKIDRDSWRRNYFMAISVVSPQYWIGVVSGLVVASVAIAVGHWGFGL